MFNLRRLQAVTKVKVAVSRGFLAADDCVMIAESARTELQTSKDKFAVKMLTGINREPTLEFLSPDLI